MSKKSAIHGAPALEQFGMRSGDRGTHTSRTIMFAELSRLLEVAPKHAPRPEYLRLIKDENLLGKKTGATRHLTAQRLSELYGLNPGVPIFRILRDLWEVDRDGRPLLAFLCAAARDPLLRMTSDPVFSTQVGEIVTKEQIQAALARQSGGRFNPSTLDKIARNAGSSWTQSGHLKGRVVKTRTLAHATPATVAFSLLLGYVDGKRGIGLFESFWARLLDRSRNDLLNLATAAARLGMIDFKQVGHIVEVSFPRLLTDEERQMLDGQS